MRRILLFLLLSTLAFSQWSCSLAGGTVIKGNISGAENLQVYLDRVVIGRAATILAKTDLGGNGQFKLSFPDGLPAGVYNLRIGARPINLILNGDEKTVEIKGDLNTVANYEVEIKGSHDSEIFAQTMRSLIARQMSAQDINSFVDTVSSPVLGAFIAYRALGTAGQYLDTQKKAHNKLAQAFPDDELTRSYGEFINVVELQYQEVMAQELVQVGQPAPDIRLKSPSGKEYALSDLKGKVVLLDFWAAWCGPCRRENPNVVAVYNKYKDRGFTIFSVSLDGVDDMIRARMSSPDELNNAVNSSRQRWMEAIKADGLSWEYHVSDLKRWDSSPANVYGVRSIPRAFMIDREGKIANTSVRGAQMIEEELLKLL